MDFNVSPCTYYYTIIYYMVVYLKKNTYIFISLCFCMIFKANSGFHHRNQALESLWPHGLCAVLAMCRAPRGPRGGWWSERVVIVTVTVCYWNWPFIVKLPAGRRGYNPFSETPKSIQIPPFILVRSRDTPRLLTTKHHSHQISQISPAISKSRRSDSQADPIFSREIEFQLKPQLPSHRFNIAIENDHV